MSRPEKPPSLGAGAVVLITAVALVATAAAVVGDAVGALALVDASHDTDSSESRLELTAAPNDTDGAIAVGKSMTGSRSIISYTLEPAKRAVAVRFAVPTRCAASVDVSDVWPEPSGACTDSLGLTGTVSAVVAYADDELVVEVDMPVDPLCYANVVLGEAYSRELTGCAG